MTLNHKTALFRAIPQLQTVNVMSVVFTYL